MKEPFDIRAPGKLNPPYGQLPGGEPEPEDHYDQINLMCFLLEGMKYKDLYGGQSLASVCQHMRDRILNRDNGGLLTPGVVQQAASILQEMITWLSKHRPTLTLRVLYEAEQSGDVETNVIDPLRELMRLSGNRLCFPFMAVQDRAHQVRPNDMAKHILDIGEYDYRDLYDLSEKKAPKLPAAVRTARGLGILNAPKTYRAPSGRGERGRQVAAPEGGGGGNFRKCDAAQGCVDNTQNTFCNIAEDGSCSTVTG